MKKFILLLIVLYNITVASGQNIYTAIIRDMATREPLTGASVVLHGSTSGATSGIDGMVQMGNIPDGRQVIVISFIGYETHRDTLDFPSAEREIHEVYLKSAAEEVGEVVISSTRSTRTIENIPTRAEFIAGEELEEKGNMKPGDIRMLLNESTGIQTQQTSATSYNSSIRIQGLDGKYTQILKDGLPLYSGFSGGLSLLQIVPLDLKQVEVIKGASSTLYGGGAIAGLVNLISKAPGENPELNFLINGTSALGFDVSGFYSQKSGFTGTTIFASYNLGSPYDPSNSGFTAIPEFRRYTINPVLFLYPGEETVINLGFTAIREDRTGGDIKFIQGTNNSNHSYFEENNTKRFSTRFVIDHSLNESSELSVKNSFSFYDRSISTPFSHFSGVQNSSFTEISFNHEDASSEWVAGLNLWTDGFSQDKEFDTVSVVDYNHVTYGLFIQNTWSITGKLMLETGLRGDYQNKYGFFALPRVSALLKTGSGIALRLGGGLGYKTPTVFTEDAERLQFRNVLPVNSGETKAERSYGGNFDINYRTRLEDVGANLNVLLFYTQVQDPLILEQISGGYFEFMQPEGFIDTKGLEVNIKLSYGNFKLFTGYTFADVKEHYDATVSKYPLVSRHRLNNVLMFEIEESLKIGLEAYYTGPQLLNDGKRGQGYWITGLMIEKLWENFSLFINFENITDTRQTRFDTIYTGPVNDPFFRDIYAPLDGFVVNGGIKVAF